MMQPQDFETGRFFYSLRAKRELDDELQNIVEQRKDAAAKAEGLAMHAKDRARGAVAATVISVVGVATFFALALLWRR